MRNLNILLKRFFAFIFFTAIFSIVFLNLPKKVNAQCYGCNPNAVNLSVSPNTVGMGQPITFRVQVTDSQATTCVQDFITGVNPSSWSSCYTSGHIDLGSVCNGVATANALNATGTYEFRHQWHPITFWGQDCDDCPPCLSEPVFFTIVAGTPAPTSAPPGPGGSMRGSCGENEIDTAIGCIPFGDTNALTTFLLGWGIGIAGGIAFLLMVYAGFLIITSAGNPQRLNSGKELLVAAISGLLLLIFSVFLLRLLGKDILNLPGF